MLPHRYDCAECRDDGENLGLVALHDFAEGHFIPGLDNAGPRPFISSAMIHSALCLRICARNRKVEYASKPFIQSPRRIQTSAVAGVGQEHRVWAGWRIPKREFSI